ncbi:MAG TPA: cell division protein FtsA [Geminicoccaceae bacterium]|nr:cell division protein FtsA [Geminicoccaceae bacterium]
MRLSSVAGSSSPGLPWIDVLGRSAVAAIRPGPFAVLDVGTTKACCLVARGRPDGELDVLGAGLQYAAGLRAGEVVDAQAVEASVLAVVQEAEQRSGETLREVLLAVNTGLPTSRHVTIEVGLGRRPVTEADMRRALEQAQAEVRAEGLEALHALPVDISVDGGRRLRDPRGLIGERLVVGVHLICVGATPLQNLIACVERCHLEVARVVAAPYASGIASLSADEAELGALLLDMGGGVTGIAVFAGGRLRHLDVVPIGGQHITQDLAYGLSTGLAHAERIKNLYGSVLRRAGDERRRLEVPLVGDHDGAASHVVPRSRLAEIIQPRMEEVFQLVLDRLAAAPALPQGTQLVLTGGVSQLEGVAELAEEMFGLPARLARPQQGHAAAAAGLGDQGSAVTAAGVLALAVGGDGGLAYRVPRPAPLFGARLARLGRWLRENF